jgi:hypothetical protein
MRVSGIVSSEVVDLDSEVVKQAGLNLSRLAMTEGSMGSKMTEEQGHADSAQASAPALPPPLLVRQFSITERARWIDALARASQLRVPESPDREPCLFVAQELVEVPGVGNVSVAGVASRVVEFSVSASGGAVWLSLGGTTTIIAEKVPRSPREALAHVALRWFDPMAHLCRGKRPAPEASVVAAAALVRMVAK